MVHIFYSRVIWLKVGLISSEEKTSLSGFCIYQAGSRISKQCPNLGTVLPRRGSVGNSNRIPIRFPSDQQQDDRRHDESNNDQTPFSRPSIAFPALPVIFSYTSLFRSLPRRGSVGNSNRIGI